MSKRLAPYFYDGTLRQWQIQKRHEWNVIIKAMDIFRIGCAFTPVYPSEVRTICSALIRGKKAMSPKTWKGKP